MAGAGVASSSPRERQSVPNASSTPARSPRRAIISIKLRTWASRPDDRAQAWRAQTMAPGALPPPSSTSAIFQAHFAAAAWIVALVASSQCSNSADWPLSK